MLGQCVDLEAQLSEAMAKCEKLAVVGSKRGLKRRPLGHDFLQKIAVSSSASDSNIVHPMKKFRSGLPPAVSSSRIRSNTRRRR
jgi:hypothetical protein